MNPLFFLFLSIATMLIAGMVIAACGIVHLKRTGKLMGLGYLVIGVFLVYAASQSRDELSALIKKASVQSRIVQK